MKFIYSIVSAIAIVSSLSATEFTISSYNCGGLSEHYDYLRAAAMQKATQERYAEESVNMVLLEKIETLALKKLFGNKPHKRKDAEKKWIKKGYDKTLKNLVMDPSGDGSVNAEWRDKADALISSYKVRPVVINDAEVSQMIAGHLSDLAGSEAEWTNDDLLEARTVMGKRIFAHHLKFDIICLQEADYLDSAMFPDNYEVLIPDSDHLKNGIAWNTNRFQFVENLGNIEDRVLIVKLLDIETQKTLLVASGHLTGCNPFLKEDGATDSAAGDRELQMALEVLANTEADIKLIAMDSNVTATHPRMKILSDAGFALDYKSYLEPTCTNPHLVYNTRIDWIAMKADGVAKAKLRNIPVMGVGLNSIQTNISDHKPIAAKVLY